ncbi:unnamed protein product [Caenorhabditis auriculariae]|uniref:Uncharacterized protein n=1 Tax=Caenorhabditis auriculariae TaxID=2777116 RepID=A0A8S1GR84_9PELO|nr:unnamed protein product [Caenorhabditis auriculariae]
MTLDDVELKAGHAPANMVGGRRISNKKDRRPSEGHERVDSESSDEPMPKEIVDVDLPAKMERSYPTAAVRHTHDKPMPSVQPKAQNHQNIGNNKGQTFQPRKITH